MTRNLVDSQSIVGAESFSSWKNLLKNEEHKRVEP